MVVKKLAVLFSGSGSNLEAILQKLHGKTFGGTKIEVVLTLSNKADAGGIAKAAKFGLKSVILNHKEFASREEFDAALVEEFFRALAFNANFTLHISQIRGENLHHVAEAAFKAFAVAFRRAISINERAGVPSTKGVL